MAKKYYMKAMGERNPWGIYYSEEFAETDNLYVSDYYPWETNYRFNEGINTYNLCQLAKCIDMALNDINTTYYGTDENDEIDEEEVAKNILNTINYFFSDTDKLSKSQLNKLADLCFDFQEETNKNKELAIFLQILEIIYGEPYISGTFRGNSQGDWALYICPKALEKGLGYIEACIMGTGTEFAVSNTQLDSPEEFDYAICNYDYTELWKDDDIKKWAANNLRCSPNEVEIIEKN